MIKTTVLALTFALAAMAAEPATVYGAFTSPAVNQVILSGHLYVFDVSGTPAPAPGSAPYQYSFYINDQLVAVGNVTGGHTSGAFHSYAPKSGVYVLSFQVKNSSGALIFSAVQGYHIEAAQTAPSTSNPQTTTTSFQATNPATVYGSFNQPAVNQVLLSGHLYVFDVSGTPAPAAGSAPYQFSFYFNGQLAAVGNVTGGHTSGAFHPYAPKSGVYVLSFQVKNSSGALIFSAVQGYHVEAAHTTSSTSNPQTTTASFQATNSATVYGSFNQPAVNQVLLSGKLYVFDVSGTPAPAAGSAPYQFSFYFNGQLAAVGNVTGGHTSGAFHPYAPKSGVYVLSFQVKNSSGALIFSAVQGYHVEAAQPTSSASNPQTTSSTKTVLKTATESFTKTVTESFTKPVTATVHA